MKIGRLNSRVSRIGQKLKQDISGAVGRTTKIIRQGEKGVSKGIGMVERVADSKVVRGVQQGTLIGGRLLGASGVPQLQAAGAGLTSIGMGIKEARAAVPGKLGQVKADVSKASNKLQGRIAAEGAMVSRKVGKVTGNELERSVPMEPQRTAAAQYMD